VSVNRKSRDAMTGAGRMKNIKRFVYWRRRAAWNWKMGELLSPIRPPRTIGFHAGGR
jgi:hypothetical protein